MDHLSLCPEEEEGMRLNMMCMSRVTLVGRSEELRILSKMYRRTLNGSSEVCIVRGPSGVGKTALINAGLRDFIARGKSKGFFAHGKFEQRLGLPYTQRSFLV